MATPRLSLSRFLVKYVARDAVGLLSRGTGGVAEIRISIDGYEEMSPLYGFLQYRRRKIILKYIPEGISRLLQGTFLLSQLGRLRHVSSSRRTENSTPSMDYFGFPALLLAFFVADTLLLL